VKQFFFVPTATLQANPPRAAYHAQPCPGNPALSMIVIEHWFDADSQDAWEALPATVEIVPEIMGATVPALVATALSPLGVLPTHTNRQAFGILRRAWKCWRH